MRSINTLYRIAYGRIMFAQDEEYASICHMFHTLVHDGLITQEEEVRLRKHLMKNRPDEWTHVEFAADVEYSWEEFYWWPIGKLDQRRRFIHKMINYTRPWYITLYLLWTSQLKETEKISPDIL